MDDSEDLDSELVRGDLIGEYVIESKIGAGTFGAVYRGIQPLIGKQVAIKILGPRYSADPNVVSRFIAEARAVNQIRHKNIIDIFSFGQLPDGRHYHIMELLSGKTLDHHLRERGRLPLVEVILILRPLARALDAAHAAGIAHRDLKPANVFLGYDDDQLPFPKLLDFGIAKLMTNELPRQHVTGTGVAVGTPDYMSPEQCLGPDVDHRTDIYAFGVMAYQLMTGRLPFVGTNVVEVLVKQMTAIADPPSAVCPDLPAAIDGPVTWMLEKEKSKRPPDLATAIAALETAANASGLHVPAQTARSADLIPASTAIAAAPLAATHVRAAATPSMLVDPALSATLPSELRVSTDRIADRIVDQKPRRSPWIAAAMAIGVIGGGVLAVALGVEGHQAPRVAPIVEAELRQPSRPASPAEVADPATAPSKPSLPARPASSSIPSLPSIPHTVQVEVLANRGAEIIGPGGMVLGRAPANITLPHGTDPITLRVALPGYAPEKIEIVPSSDSTVTATLKKERKKKGDTKSEKKKPAGLDDLESFE